MSTTLLLIGPEFTMVANQVYALPARTVSLSATGVAPIQVSQDGVGWTTIALIEGVRAEVSARFIKTTGSGNTITVKMI